MNARWVVETKNHLGGYFLPFEDLLLPLLDTSNGWVDFWECCLTRSLSLESSEGYGSLFLILDSPEKGLPLRIDGRRWNVSFSSPCPLFPQLNKGILVASLYLTLQPSSNSFIPHEWFKPRFFFFCVGSMLAWLPDPSKVYLFWQRGGWGSHSLQPDVIK